MWFLGAVVKMGLSFDGDLEGRANAKNEEKSEEEANDGSNDMNSGEFVTEGLACTETLRAALEEALSGCLARVAIILEIILHWNNII